MTPLHSSPAMPAAAALPGAATSPSRTASDSDPRSAAGHTDLPQRRVPARQSLWADLAADLEFGIECDGGTKLGRIIGNRGFHGLLCYRVAHRLKRTFLSPLAFLLTRLCQVVYGIDLDPNAVIEGGVVIYHGMGLVVGHGVTIERRVILFHGVTLGIKRSGHRDGYPYVESEVVIGTGAVLLGPIRVGRNTFIGANTVVMSDVPPSSVVRPAPSAITPRDPNRKSVGVTFL